LLRSFIFASLAAASLLAADADWPQFRGPHGSGISAEKGLPVTWGSDKNIAWKIDVTGAGASSPIIAGGRIYLTSYTGHAMPGQRGSSSVSALKRHVLCLNLADGKLLWDKEAETVQPEAQRVAEHGYASSTPIVEGDRLYAFFGISGLFAFDLEGKQLWHSPAGSNTHQWGTAASPVIYKDLVIVNASVESDALVAFNKETGKEVWRAPGIRQAWNTPALVDLPNGKSELAVCIEGKVLGFDPATGKELWSAGGNGGYMCPSLVVANGAVYAPWAHRTIAVKAGGSGDVGKSHEIWNIYKSQRGSNVSSGVFFGGNLYFAADAERSRDSESVLCMNGQTAEVIAERKLDPAPGRIYSSPVIADGKFYVTARNGKTYVLSADTKLEPLAVSDLSDGTDFDASPAVAKGRLLIRSGKRLYCVGEK
jgi:hypothetical protein